MEKTRQRRATDDTKNSSTRIIQPCVIVHGGVVAGRSSKSLFVETVEACRVSASHGYQKILNGGNSVDAVEAALWWLENDEYFNCGYGSVLNNEGHVEMEACLMNGTRRECGSVVGIRGSEHPVELARYAMENYPNSIIGPRGVERLSKMAGIRAILPENMISPSSYFASESENVPCADYFDDGSDNESAEISKSTGLSIAFRARELAVRSERAPRSTKSASFTAGNRGAVGCIAWDGSTIVAGTSSGGTRGKMAGRVGAASLMGCGLFANDNWACCLTGHGESIVKTSLSRDAVDALTTDETSTPRNVLERLLNALARSSGRQAGGIAMRNDGTYGTYCTNENDDPMPWAVARRRLVVTPAPDGGEKTEKYRDLDEEISAATSSAVLESKLFSFCEWQRYVEARRTVLTDVHFPTKLKRDPEASGNSHLYLKFHATMRAKRSDREEPAIESYKHLIPRELADAMKKIIARLEESATLPLRNDTETFAPSLTPQYSYLRQLSQNPERDLPSNLTADFQSTKIGHLTRTEAFRALAARCNVKLIIAETGIHFLERVVSTFEQSNLPTFREFNRPVQVEKPVNVRTRSGGMSRESCDDLEEYLRRKNPGSLFVDSSKLNDYNVVVKSSTQRREDATDRSYNDFGFDEVFPSGKLVVRNDDDSEDEERSDGSTRRSVGDSAVRSIIDRLAEHNLSLSNREKSSLVGASSSVVARPRTSKAKRKTGRDPATGKFVSACTESRERTKHASSKVRDRGEVGTTRRYEEATTRVAVNGSAVPKASGPDNADASIPRDINFESEKSNDSNEKRSSTLLESETLFRPFADYWLLRCNFGRVKQKNFRELEKIFPSNFRWLLEECSSVVEMTEKDLYEEVCLVETYYADVLGPSKCPLSGNRYDVEEYRSKAHCNAIRKKW